MNVRIEPESGELFAKGKFKVITEDRSRREFDFNLHGTFLVQDLKVNGRPADFRTERNEPWMIIPSSKKVTVKIPRVNDRNIIDVDIIYHGKLEDIPEFGAYEDQKWALDDRINSRMIELANYSCWYPQFSFGVRFDTDLVLSLPEGWNGVCSGKKTAEWKEDGRMLSRWLSADDTDIVVVASPQLKLKTHEGSKINIQIYHTQMPDDFLDSEIRQIERTVDLYTHLLGPTVIPAGTVKHVFSPKRKGQGGAGIARPGMIVTSEGRTLDALKKDPDFSLFHGIAHEIAHFWWNFGSGQGDWVNETFAEYFASVADQHIMSEEKFENNLERYSQMVEGLPDTAPPLSSVPFAEGETNYIVRYYKGSLMLDDIRGRIGDKRFFEICRNFFSEFHRDLIGTPEFRNFWGKRIPEHQEVLNAWLDSAGGLPIFSPGFNDANNQKAGGKTIHPSIEVRVGAGIPVEDYLHTHIFSGFGATIPLKRRLSLSLDLGYWRSTVEEIPDKFYDGHLKAFPLLASFQFFFSRHERINPYIFIGGGYIFCSFTMQDIITIPEITIDQTVKSGPCVDAGIGIDVIVSHSFGIRAEATHFFRKTTGITTITDINFGTSTREFPVNLNAWIFRIGIRYSIE